LFAVARVVAWVWALLAGVGGFALLLHEGPLPITNGWFAMFSGVAACPLTAWLLKKYAGVTISTRSQLAIALLIFIAGRIAVVIFARSAVRASMRCRLLVAVRGASAHVAPVAIASFASRQRLL
jgi:hypothetical protein